MVKEKDKIVDAFVRAVRKSVSPCRIILFGSRAKKSAKEDSDYDFLLISPRFKKWEWERRSAEMYRLKRNIPAAMDIICLTPDEFERKQKEIGVIQEVVREGIEIKAS